MTPLTPQPARAAGSWYVKPTGNDGNVCTSPDTACVTINGAIAKASSGDTIYVEVRIYTGPGDEVVLIGKNVTLSARRNSNFTTQNRISAIDEAGVRRGITVNSGVTTTVERCTVQNGSSGSGAGINNGGSLTLNNSTVSGNSAWNVR